MFGVPNSTFHPKMAWFQGDSEAQGFVGSNNFTVGGTETNCEAGVHMHMELPSDDVQLADFTEAWDQLEPLVMTLDPPLLKRLVADGYVVGERICAGVPVEGMGVVGGKACGSPRVYLQTA